jgi:predicted  nucleic acid-binding Zn-ribbon protein
MYLEERVEQLENLAVDQGKHIEIIASGLATLTAQVQKGFSDMRKDITKLNDRVESLESKVDRLDVRVSRIEVRLDKIETRLDNMETKMDQRFDELVMLIKSK